MTVVEMEAEGMEAVMRVVAMGAAMVEEPMGEDTEGLRPRGTEQDRVRRSRRSPHKCRMRHSPKMARRRRTSRRWHSCTRQYR